MTHLEPDPNDVVDLSHVEPDPIALAHDGHRDNGSGA